MDEFTYRLQQMPKQLYRSLTTGQVFEEPIRGPYLTYAQIDENELAAIKACDKCDLCEDHHD